MRRPANTLKFIMEKRSDDRLTITHISFLTALLSYWAESGYRNTFNVTRKRIMERAKIKSITTYHKCIRELVAYNYIKYFPSYNKFEGSRVELLF